MKKTSKHILTIDFFKDLASLLDQGYSLNEALMLLYSFHQDDNIKVILHHLNNGEEFNEILEHFKVSKTFFDFYIFLNATFSISQSIEKAIELYGIFDDFKKTLQKNLAYPIFLILIMMAFAFFMSSLVLPEISSLLASFNLSNVSLLEKLVSYFPYLVIVLVIYLLSLLFYIYLAFKTLNVSYFKSLFKIKMIRELIQYYFSIKFAIYFGSVIHLNMGIKDCMDLLIKTSKTNDLILCIASINEKLNNGQSLDECINHCLYFHSTFKSYYSFISSSKQAISEIKKYASITIDFLQSQFKKILRFIMIFIYVFSALFIVILYWLMLFPIINVISSF